MEGGIDPNAPLDYAEFELFPSQNRYEVCICNGNKVETVAPGFLEQLLLHSPKVKKLYSKRPNATFKIQLPDSLNGAEWFTKSTLTRFLHMVGSSEILDITEDFENEISQLDKTRRFQLSIAVKGRQNQFGSGEIDCRKLNYMEPTSKVEVEMVSSDASKNELLRAMDLRLAALREELATAFNRAAGTSSPKELIDLETFSHHFGAMDIRNSLRKFVELSQNALTVGLPSDGKFLFTNISSNGSIIQTDGDMQMSKSSHTDTPVKYGVSPAKIAQLERQNSTESEESSFSSEVDQPSVERSRTLVRSASPRRSASPMRRIQIGRSGLRRASTLTIKSLNHFPSRERAHTDDTAKNSTEGSEQPPRKSENNVQRISVQAAISLFESKQRDQTVDLQKPRSLLNTSVGANKSVLRRWSSGMGESSARWPPDNVTSSSVQITPDDSAAPEISEYSQEVKQESDFQFVSEIPVETVEADLRSESSEKTPSNQIGVQVGTISTKQEETSEKFSASVEWSQQKEAELNQMLMKMMENKPVKYQKKVPDKGQRKNVSGPLRGGFYDHYKQKRDEKLREASGKRGEKEAQFKAMQKSLDERKAEMGSANAGDVGRRHTTSKAQKSTKNSSLPANPIKETPQPAVVMKASSKASLLPATNPIKETPQPAVVMKTSSKASLLPATRKSWPTSPRAIGTSPAKALGVTSSSGITLTRQKPQQASSVPRSSPKVERSQPRPKTVQATQIDSNKIVKAVNEKKQTVTKKGKTTNTKVQPPSRDYASTAKPSLYNMVTKKSSVVPLESKPSLRKESEIGTHVSPVIKIKVSSLPEESFWNLRDQIQAKENELVTKTSDLASKQQERDLDESEIHTDLEPESQVITPQKCRDAESSNLLDTSVDDNVERMAESTVRTGAEEVSIISPTAWVEIEEEYQHEPVRCVDRSCQIATTANVAAVGITSPRVRHSLSQMLLEESSEPDISEWGYAENPPAMVYQKDAPKGLKRLLKFARKSKLDAHLSGWSSPSAFSEGEDEAEEYKASKKYADNLLRKATLNGKNYGVQKNTSREAYEKNSAQSNVSKFSQCVQERQEGHITTSVTTSKATRSFFSLSAFKGNKPNHVKLQ